MWEIYAYQNADSLFGVFNAAAAIHASGDYAAALAAVAFCGFVAALIAYAFAPEKLQGWKWLGTVVLVFSVLIVPKVTVGIVDKTGGSAVKVVGNVPFGVAALGGITSTIGNTLTSLFETAFQVIPGVGALPVELSYQQNGLMFGNRLIRETGNVVFPGSGLPHRPDQLHPQLHDLRPDRRHARSGSLFCIGRCLAADGLTQSGALQHADRRWR
jgi:conjugal transfer mating pair stabilization protein TraG